MKSYNKNIIIYHQPNAGYSFVGVFLLAGSRYEKKSGVAHVCEHLLLPDSDQYFAHEAEVGKEVLSLSSTQLPVDTAKAFESLINTLNKPVDGKRLQKELKTLSVELEEYGLDEDYQKLLKAMFGSHPYAKSAGGDAESLESITQADIESFMKDHLSVKSGVWVVSGNFDKAEIESIVKKYDIEADIAPFKAEPLPLKKEISYIIESQEEGDWVAMVIPLVPNGEFIERVRLMVVRAALVGYEFSYLNQILREKERLIYSTETETHFYKEAGYLTISMFASKGGGEKIINLLSEAFGNIEASLTDETILKAKKRLILELTQAKGRPEAVGMWLGEDMILSGETLDINDVMADIENMTPEVVRETAGLYFDLNLKKSK